MLLGMIGLNINSAFMKPICIIPARGGSKRIPRKNIKLFRGKPLISWVINLAKELKIFERIIVSTDDIEIADYSKSIGAEVPFMRPGNLSDDFSNTMDVMKFMVNKLIESSYDIEYVCCLYATAPIILKSDLEKSFQILEKMNSDQILFGATSFGYPIQRALILDEKNNSSILNKEYLFTRSQDLQDTFHDAGQFYWGTAKSWLKTSNVLEEGRAFIIPRWRVQDIDVQEDWERAESIHRELRRRKL